MQNWVVSLPRSNRTSISGDLLHRFGDETAQGSEPSPMLGRRASVDHHKTLPKYRIPAHVSEATPLNLQPRLTNFDISEAASLNHVKTNPNFGIPVNNSEATSMNLQSRIPVNFSPQMENGQVSCKREYENNVNIPKTISTFNTTVTSPRNTIRNTDLIGNSFQVPSYSSSPSFNEFPSQLNSNYLEKGVLKHTRNDVSNSDQTEPTEIGQEFSPSSSSYSSAGLQSSIPDRDKSTTSYGGLQGLQGFSGSRNNFAESKSKIGRPSHDALSSPSFSVRQNTPESILR